MLLGILCYISGTTGCHPECSSPGINHFPTDTSVTLEKNDFRVEGDAGLSSWPPSNHYYHCCCSLSVDKLENLCMDGYLFLHPSVPSKIYTFWVLISFTVYSSLPNSLMFKGSPSILIHMGWVFATSSCPLLLKDRFPHFTWRPPAPSSEPHRGHPQADTLKSAWFTQCLDW